MHHKHHVVSFMTVYIRLVIISRAPYSLVDTAEAAMDAAQAASATGAKAAAAKPDDLGPAELASHGRLICAAATAALKETVDTRDFNKDGQYSPETPSHGSGMRCGLGSM